MLCYLLRLIENVENSSHTNGSQVISTTNAVISRADQSCHANRSALAVVQLATSLRLGNRCSWCMVDPDEWFDDLDLDSPC